jgi:hypothetical protein
MHDGSVSCLNALCLSYLLDWNYWIGTEHLRLILKGPSSRAVPVISSPLAMLYFYCSLHCAQYLLGCSRHCHAIQVAWGLFAPCFFSPRRVPETMRAPSRVSVVCGVRILIRHSLPFLFLFIYSRGIRHRAWHVPASAAPHPNCTSAWSSWGNSPVH